MSLKDNLYYSRHLRTGVQRRQHVDVERRDPAPRRRLQVRRLQRRRQGRSRGNSPTSPL